MSRPQPTQAAAIATPRPAAPADDAAARACLDAAQAMLLAFLAALLGSLVQCALFQAPRPLAHQLPHSPYAVPFGTPGPRTARHRGPVPARAQRLGRFPLWWSRNRGARARPIHARAPRRTQHARAPPRPVQTPSVTKQRPNQGAPTRAH